MNPFNMLTSRYAYARFAPEDGGTSGDTGSSEATKAGDTGQQSSAKDNKEDNVAPFAELWHNRSSSTEGKDSSDEPKTIVVEQQPAQQSEADFLKDHIASMELTKGIDSPEVMKSMEAGDHKPFLESLETVASRAYQAALRDSNLLYQKDRKKLKEEILAETNASVGGNLAVKKLHTDLPFTENEAVAPVAKAILAQMMNQGNDEDTAVKQTGEFFKFLSKLSAKDLGLNTPPRSQPGGRGFNGSGPVGDVDSNSSVESWVEALGGPTPQS